MLDLPDPNTVLQPQENARSGPVSAGELQAPVENPALEEASPPLEIHSAVSRDDDAAERIRFRTAAEFAAEVPPDVPWAVRPWVAKGSVTEIVGPPKSAGKTTFVLAMLRAGIDGRPFLDAPPESDHERDDEQF